MRISDWSSDVCSSDLSDHELRANLAAFSLDHRDRRRWLENAPRAPTGYPQHNGSGPLCSCLSMLALEMYCNREQTSIAGAFRVCLQQHEPMTYEVGLARWRDATILHHKQPVLNR